MCLQVETLLHFQSITSLKPCQRTRGANNNLRSFRPPHAHPTTLPSPPSRATTSRRGLFVFSSPPRFPLLSPPKRGIGQGRRGLRFRCIGDILVVGTARPPAFDEGFVVHQHMPAVERVACVRQRAVLHPRVCAQARTHTRVHSPSLTALAPPLPPFPAAPTSPPAARSGPTDPLRTSGDDGDESEAARSGDRVDALMALTNPGRDDA